MKSRIKLLLVDDHPVVRCGIRSFLAREEHLTIVGEAAGGVEGLRKARELLPDVILLDIEMPDMNGLAVTIALHKELPQIKVLILSVHRNAEDVLHILRSGARGYVLKDGQPEELVRAIETVQHGEAYFSPSMARLVVGRFVHGSGRGSAKSLLTIRECEVLVQIAEGLINKEIAGKLGVGVRTVETHRERIMRKLNIHSVAGLTRFAISEGLVFLRQGSPSGPEPRRSEPLLSNV